MLEGLQRLTVLHFDLAACRGTSKADAFCPQGPSLLFVTNRNRDSRLEPQKTLKTWRHDQRNDEEMTKWYINVFACLPDSRHALSQQHSYMHRSLTSFYIYFKFHLLSWQHQIKIMDLTLGELSILILLRIWLKLMNLHKNSSICSPCSWFCLFCYWAYRSALAPGTSQLAACFSAFEANYT